MFHPISFHSYSALIHVTLDQYKQRVTEEELYSDVNFIIQDQGDYFITCIYIYVAREGT